jgi:hypothetical protein
MGANAQIAVPAFTAGQVLTATQQTQINTGIPVFATTVTRDAAFGGTGEKVLAQGQYAYIEATSTLQVYNGSAWVNAVSSGLIAVVPSSVAVGSGTGTANANGQVTFSGASSISLNGVFTSTYVNYLMLFNIQSRSTSNFINLRFRASGTDNTSALYDTQYLRANSTTVGANNATTQTSAQFITTTTNSPSFATATIYQPQVASLNSYFYCSSNVGVPAAGYIETMVGGINNTTQFDGLSLITTAGTITGVVSIYGLVN